MTLKTFKKILKVLLWILLGILGLLLLVSILLYVPSVQRFAVGKISTVVGNTTGMRLDVGRFRLKVPLRIEVDNTTLITPACDTLVGFDRLRVDVALWPLLAGNIRSPHILLENAQATYRDTVSNMLLDARLAHFGVRGAGLRLKDNAVKLSRVSVSGVDALLDLGESHKTDTVRVDTTASAAWSFALRRVGLNDIKFGMRTSPNVTELAVDLPQGVIRRASVDLGTQDVSVALIQLTDGFYSYLIGPSAAETKPGPEAAPATEDSLPWTVMAGRVELVNNAGAYGTLGGTPAPGFDPANIRADSIGLLVEDILYKGSDISAELRRLHLHERSGLRVTKGEGGFSMTQQGISLQGFTLATANSAINADARVGAGIIGLESSTPLEATLSAAVGMGDVFLLVPLDASAKSALRGKSLTVGGGFSGTLADISIDRLTASMPGHADFNVHGEVRSVLDPGRLSGQVVFDGSLRNAGFARGFIADTALRRRIGFPDRMTLAGRASFTPGVYDLTRFSLTADGGRIDANGKFDTRSKSYRANLDIRDLPLHAFLPNDSLGVATLTLGAEGRGFDPMADMAAAVELTVEKMEYNSYDFGRVAVDATVSDGRIAANIDSSSDALVFTMDIEGSLRPDKYSARVTGNIRKADLYGMRMSSDALAVTTILDVTASAVPDTTKMHFAVDATIDSTILHYGANTQRIARTTVRALSDESQTSAGVRSGDLSVDFSSPLALDSLAGGFGSVARELNRQIGERNISMNGIRAALPDMRLEVSAGRGNVLREMARASGLDFRRVMVGVSTVGSAPLRAGVEVDGFRTGTLTLDTINVWARQRGDSLGYALRLANRPGNIESLALIYLYGDVAANRASLNLLQRNRADSTGFRFGIGALLLDSMVRATFTPEPTLGYRPWSVNEDNYIEYRFDNRLYADLQLQGPGKHITLGPAPHDFMDDGALRLAMSGIDISNLLDLLPTAPPIDGTVSSDLSFGLHEGLVAARGSLGVAGFEYGRKRVADVAAQIDFQSQAEGVMSLDAAVELDSQTALTAKGTYATADGGNMDFAVSIPGLPLAVANPFLPEGVASLSGVMDGRVALKGPPAAMEITGDAGFTDGRVEIGLIGTSYGISRDRITASGGAVRLNGFGLTAPNNQKLSLNGSVDIRDFSRMRADIAVLANNFQAIDSDHRGGSQVYGKAALDVDVTARGPLDALTIRGGVNLRANTDVTYILRDQVKQVSDQRQDVVRFMVFADSLFMETYAPVETLRKASSVDMLVGVNIEEGLQAKVSLDELGENRVELVGGGTLNYSMNSQGDMRLSGRYTLSGGTVIYKPPVISQKVFAVEDGSYVEFVGEVADPAFNVRATQTMSVDVDMGSGAQPVSFDISIAIAGSLQGMQITFDVAAPANAAIQSQLMSMAPEQRMQQALSLLLYNQYTGPGAASQAASVDARGQLNSFISKEVNQWARNNLKGVELSVGIDSRDDGTGNEHTDYSYSVSKSLFSDRVKVSVGGSVSDNANAQNFSDNLVDDLSLEYRLTKRDNMFLKVYRYNTQQTIFEGEVTETGVGFLMRKKMNRMGDLFRLDSRRQSRMKNEE